jgi:hypothetical protein
VSARPLAVCSTGSAAQAARVTQCLSHCMHHVARTNGAVIAGQPKRVATACSATETATPPSIHASPLSTSASAVSAPLNPSRPASNEFGVAPNSRCAALASVAPVSAHSACWRDAAAMPINTSKPGNAPDAKPVCAKAASTP